jgi:hypothetical protein
MKSQLSESQREQLRSCIASVVCKFPETGVLITELRKTDDFELLAITTIAAALSGVDVRKISDFLRENGVCASDLERVFHRICDAGQGPANGRNASQTQLDEQLRQTHH